MEQAGPAGITRRRKRAGGVKVARQESSRQGRGIICVPEFGSKRAGPQTSCGTTLGVPLRWRNRQTQQSMLLVRAREIPTALRTRSALPGNNSPPYQHYLSVLRCPSLLLPPNSKSWVRMIED
mmetsp:Transcript_16693/g.36401  ORF Transcript_16693/g.36401 Transcript_16693/m.36401 type:complete len:123 (+) Transcript_16693:327-695(+)